VGEVEGARTEYEKVYLTVTGEYVTARYQTPVHYIDSDGYFQTIDNRLNLQENEDEEEVYKNAGNSVAAQFAASTVNSKLVSISNIDYNMSWNIFAGIASEPPTSDTSDPYNENRVEEVLGFFEGGDGYLIGEDYAELAPFPDMPEQDGNNFTQQLPISSLKYANAFGAHGDGKISLNYALTSDILKQEIVISEPIDVNTFGMFISVDSGDDASLAEDGSLVFEDEFGAYHEFTAPLLTTADGVTTRNARFDTRGVTDALILKPADFHCY
jgi:hypothetical protein